MQVKPQNYYHNERVEMLNFMPEKVNACLEAGCGVGNFSYQVADKFGAEVWGIEPNKQSAQKAQRVLHKVYNSTIEDAIDKLPSHYFEAIVFNDVLEHLYDPELTIKKLRNKLKSKGVIVASIPNIRYYHNFYSLVRHADWDYEESGVLDFTHLRFFTHRSIEKMFNRAGYKIEVLEGINPTSHIPLKFRLLNELSGGQFNDCKYIQFAVRASLKS